MASEYVAERVLGVVLAGGRSRRMGTDKAWLDLGGEPLVARVAGRLAPQVGRLVVNGDFSNARLAGLGLPVVADSVAGHPGPLAGVLAGMDHALASGLDWVATAPVDAPFIPGDLVARLMAERAQAGAQVAVACSNGKRHPVCALWPAALAGDLRARLDGGLRRVDLYAREQGCVLVDWPIAAGDPFQNLNTPDDLAGARRRLG